MPKPKQITVSTAEKALTDAEQKLAACTQELEKLDAEIDRHTRSDVSGDAGAAKKLDEAAAKRLRLDARRRLFEMDLVAARAQLDAARQAEIDQVKLEHATAICEDWLGAKSDFSDIDKGLDLMRAGLCRHFERLNRMRAHGTP